MRCTAEVAVGRDQPLQRLVWPLEIVAIEVQRQPARAVVEVGEDGTAEKLVPERLPESFDFSERHRMLGAALDVANAVAAQQSFEFGLPTPRGVLPAVVRQDFAGCAETRDTALQRFQHERRALVVRQHVADHEAAVVIHEDGQVQPLVAPQQEGEDIRLPHLIRLGPLETTWPVLPCLGCCGSRTDEPFLVQDASDQRFADPNALVTCELIPDAPRPVLRVLALRRLDRLALWCVWAWWLGLAAEVPGARLQAVVPSGLPAHHPAAQRTRRHPDRPGHVRYLAPAIHHRLDGLDPELQRVRLSCFPVDVSGLGKPSCLACLARPLRRAPLSCCHPVSPFR